MSIRDLRADLEEARAHIAQIESSQAKMALDKLDQALKDLAGARLLTTAEATEWLGLASETTLKLLIRSQGLSYTFDNDCMMIPLSELERIQNSSVVRGIRISDHIHDATKGLGAIDGLTPEQMEDLEAARPGRLPWER
jgi:hypothetical protein